MKPITYFSLFLLVGLCLLSFVAEAENGKIVKSNWPSQYMGTHTYTVMESHPTGGYFEIIDFSLGTVAWNSCPCPFSTTIDIPITQTIACIKRDANDNIEIRLEYAIADINYEQYAPTIHLRYTVAGQSATISHDAMTYSGQIGDYHYFSKMITFHIPQENTTIVSAGQNLFDFGVGFDYKFEIITSDGTAYPIHNHATLFKQYTDLSPSPTVEQGGKRLCSGNVSRNYFLQSGNINQAKEQNKNNIQSSDTSTQLIAPKERKNNLFSQAIHMITSVLENIFNSAEDIKNQEFIDKVVQDNDSGEPSFSTDNFSNYLIINAYPNPFNQQFSIESMEDIYGRIEIFNTQGRLVYKEENITFVQKSPKRIDTAHFSAGMYYCTIITDNGQTTIPLVKSLNTSPTSAF